MTEVETKGLLYTINEVDLRELLQNYTNKLCNRVFVITLSNNTIIKINFFRESMCHLMGLQHVFSNDRRYLGSKGYKRIESGDLTIADLKIHNKKGYSFIKDRLRHFDEIKNVVLNGRILKFYEERVKGNRGSVINADFVMCNDKEQYLLHLFLKKEQGTDSYAPIYFVPMSYSDKIADKYIAGQERKHIIACKELKS